MCLLMTSTLVLLYNAANAPGAQEQETVDFWRHLLIKSLFPEERFVIVQGTPPVTPAEEFTPAEESSRRVDRASLPSLTSRQRSFSYAKPKLLVD
jgi:hypothetical protein